MTTEQKINRALDRLELLQVEIDRVITAFLQDLREASERDNRRKP